MYSRREFGYPEDRTESFKRCKNGPGAIIAPFEGRSLPEYFTGKELSVGTAPMADALPSLACDLSGWHSYRHAPPTTAGSP